MISKIINYIKLHKFTYFICAICLFIEYSLSVIPTKVINYIIDEIHANTLNYKKSYIYLFIILASAIICYIAAYFWISKLWGRQHIFKREIRDEMFEKIIKMKTPYFEKFRSGDMLTRFTTDTNDFSEVIGVGIMSIFMSLSTFIFVLPAMFSISFFLSIYAIIPIIISSIIIAISSKKFEKSALELREAISTLNNEILEIVEGIRIIRAYGNKIETYEKFKEKTKNLTKKANKIAIYNSIFGKLSNFSVSISTIIIISMGTFYVKNGILTLGNLVALQLYTITLLYPIWILTDLITNYKTAKIAYNKIEEILKETDNIEKNGNINLKNISEIEFKNYNFKYNNSNKYSLININLKIKKGQTIGIVGKTGSGKTTLIRQFLQQYPTGDGNFLINKIDIKNFNKNSIENKISYVPQEHILFSNTVKENIKFGKNNATDDEISKVIYAASLENDLKNMQNGIETLIGEKGVSISGGQKQRISIARAFLKNSDILILDDSLSAVDANTERNIIENIKKLRKNKTNIIVTHRLSAINQADWIIVLNNGKIEEEGTVNMLINNKGWYYEQFIRQQMNEETII